MSDDDHPVAGLIAAGVFVLVCAFVYKFLKSIASDKPGQIISYYEAQELARYARALVKKSAARKSHYDHAHGNTEKIAHGMKAQRGSNDSVM